MTFVFINVFQCVSFIQWMFYEGRIFSSKKCINECFLWKQIRFGGVSLMVITDWTLFCLLFTAVLAVYSSSHGWRKQHSRPLNHCEITSALYFEPHVNETCHSTIGNVTCHLHVYRLVGLLAGPDKYTCISTWLECCLHEWECSGDGLTPWFSETLMLFCQLFLFEEKKWVISPKTSQNTQISHISLAFFKRKWQNKRLKRTKAMDLLSMYLLL